MRMNIHIVSNKLTSEQKKLVKQAEQGDESAAFRLCQYNFDDTIMHHELAKLFLPFALNITKISKTDLNSINSFSKKKIAGCLWDYLHLKRTSMLRYGKEKEKYGDFAINAKTKKGFAWFRDRTIDEKLKFETRKGLFKKAYVSYLPFSKGLKDFFNKNELTKKLCDLIDTEKNAISKIIYLQMQDALAIEPLRDLLEIEQREDYEYQFNRKYSFFAGENANSEELRNAFENELENLVDSLASNKLINYSNNLVFIENIEDDEIKLMQELGFVNLGYCDMISVEKGQVIYKLKDEILCSGISIPSKEKRESLDFEQGQMTNIEKRVLRDVTEALFVDNDGADVVENEIQSIEQGNISVTDYISAVNVTEESKNVSYKAKGKRSVEAVRKLGAKQGEILLYVTVNDEKIKYLGYQPDKDRFYYIERKSVDGKRSARRKYVTYNKKKKRFSNGMEIDKQKYIEIIFGESSKLTTILRAA